MKLEDYLSFIKKLEEEGAKRGYIVSSFHEFAEPGVCGADNFFLKAEDHKLIWIEHEILVPEEEILEVSASIFKVPLEGGYSVSYILESLLFRECFRVDEDHMAPEEAPSRIERRLEEAFSCLTEKRGWFRYGCEFRLVDFLPLAMENTARAPPILYDHFFVRVVLMALTALE